MVTADGMVLAFPQSSPSICERMSDTSTIAATAAPPGPAPHAAVPRPLSDAVDLYAEGNSFSEQTWAGPGIEALFGKDGFDFKDVLDIVNPLQHLPVVGTAHRALTGDTLEPGPRLLGGALYGGVGGFISALVNAVYEDETGKDIGATVLALFTDDKAPGPAVATAAVAGAAAKTDAPTPDTASAIKSAGPTPTAPSPLAIAGHAKSPGLPLSMPAAQDDDPTAALIRAQIAVPPTSRSDLAGLPPMTRSPLLAMAGNKSLPNQFPRKTAPASALKHAGADAATASPGDNAVARPAPSVTPDAKTASEPAPDVAAMMMRALDKYETLMKSRTAPSISSEI